MLTKEEVEQWAINTALKVEEVTEVRVTNVDCTFNEEYDVFMSIFHLESPKVGIGLSFGLNVTFTLTELSDQVVSRTKEAIELKNEKERTNKD